MLLQIAAIVFIQNKTALLQAVLLLLLPAVLLLLLPALHCCWFAAVNILLWCIWLLPMEEFPKVQICSTLIEWRQHHCFKALAFVVILLLLRSICLCYLYFCCLEKQKLATMRCCHCWPNFQILCCSNNYFKIFSISLNLTEVGSMQVVFYYKAIFTVVPQNIVALYLILLLFLLSLVWISKNILVFIAATIKLG